MIILEGLDNTGKTTLANQILEAVPQLKLRPSIGNKHDPVVIRNGIYMEAMLNSTLILSDRSRLISEYVYSPVLQGREPVIDYSTWMTYLTLFTQKTHLIIYCHRPVSVILQTFHEREQLEGVGDSLVELNGRYEQMMTMLDLLFTLNSRPDRIVRYNWATTPLPQVMMAVTEYMKEVGW